MNLVFEINEAVYFIFDIVGFFHVDTEIDKYEVNTFMDFINKLIPFL